jgi:hypothetical protein
MENKEKAYAVDEHFYKSPEWFLENIHRYDDYDRSLPKVFAGEYAAHSCPETARRVSNWKMALCEAAFLTGVEQNADHVVMSCYAPLFGRTGRAQWQPDLIWFDNDSAYGTPSYYVQQLYSRCTGTTLVEANGCDLPCSTTLSEDKRTLYVKLVNLSDAEQDIELQIDRPVLGGSLHELSGDLEAVNSHEAPTRISTRTCPLPDAFPHIHLKKNSVTVLELGI